MHVTLAALPSIARALLALPHWSLPGRPALPPVDRRALVQVVCRDLDISQVAELPELLDGTGVLEQNMVHIERVQLVGTKAIDRLSHVRDELGKRRLVIGRHYLACSLTL